jgi:hypothetical protein
MGTGAVSRYNLSRSQKSVTVHDFNWGQMRVSGCIHHYKAVLGAGAKAKTVTNNLPILSVLAFRRYLSFDRVNYGTTSNIVVLLQLKIVVIIFIPISVAVLISALISSLYTGAFFKSLYLGLLP